MKEMSYYEILGASKKSSLDELRIGFMQEVNEHFYKEGELKKVKAILEAYSVLSNPDNRACYDLNELIKNGKSTTSFDLLSRSMTLSEEYISTSPESSVELLNFLGMLSECYYKMAINLSEDCGQDNDILEAIRELIDSISNNTIISSHEDRFVPRMGYPENE